MIAKENINNAVIPNLSLPDGKTLNYLLDAIIAASEPFKKASNQSNLVKPLNENKLTQILVEQIEVKIKPHPFIGVKNQYSDLFCRTTGIPDFYFHVVEEGVAHLPLMIVESKR